MKVLVFQVGYTGHYCEYLRRILDALLQYDIDVVVALPQGAADAQEYHTHLNGFSGPRVTWKPFRSRLAAGHWASGLEQAATLRGLIKDEKPDHLYVPQAEGVSPFAAVIPLASDGLVSEGLHFFGGYGYESPQSSWLGFKSQVRGRLVTTAKWAVFSHTDPWQLKWLCGRYPELATRAVIMPDPVVVPKIVDRTRARRLLGLPLHGRAIGLVGPLTRRKGCDLLVQAFANALPDSPAGSFLFLAGRVATDLGRDTEESIEALTRRGRLFLLDKHLSTEEIESAIQALDVVCLPYRNHAATSGIALRAIASEKPLLTSSRYWLGRIASLKGVGVTCDVLNRREFSRAISDALGADFRASRTPEVQALLRFHSTENFARVYTQGLRLRLGLGVNGPHVSCPYL